MHGPIKVKSSNNTSKWQMGFNSAFKGLISSDIVTVLAILEPSIYLPLIARIPDSHIPLKLKERVILTLIFFVPGKWSSVIEATLLAEQQRQTSLSIATGIPKQLL
jgi:hypothetical protein